MKYILIFLIILTAWLLVDTIYHYDHKLQYWYRADRSEEWQHLEVMIPFPMFTIGKILETKSVLLWKILYLFPTKVLIF